MPLIVHLPMDCAVSDSVAVPLAFGFLVTLVLKPAVLQLRLNRLVANTAVVPLARLALSTAPVLTAVPPALLMVRTLEPPVVAALGATGAARAVRETAVIA